MNVSGGEVRGEDGTPEGRRVVYCLIPADLAPSLHEPLRRHFRDDPGVEVVVERRHRQRRSGEDRRLTDAEPGSPGGGDEAEAEAPGAERRRIRGTGGRRTGERRAAVAPVEPPPLPRRARRHAERLSFFERLEPPTEQAEDEDTARVVARFQAGDQEAFATLYTRYFGRVYAYLRVLLRDSHEAEDLTQQAFVQVLQHLDRYERRRQPFRAWLFAIARNQAADHFRSRHGIEFEELDERKHENAGVAPAEERLTALGWITDTDLMILMERLPPAQRQVLALRYLLGLKSAEVAAVTDRSPEAVRMLHSRALAFLRERLTALGREPKTGRRPPSRRWQKQARVLRVRRFSLTSPGPTG